MTEVDAAEVRRAMEYYYERGWTDGLPVIPVTESYLAEFMTTTSRDPDEVLIPIPHLNKNLTVRLAAINAALAGCLPEYFPCRAGRLGRVPARRHGHQVDLGRRMVPRSAPTRSHGEVGTRRSSSARSPTSRTAIGRSST